MFYLHCTFRKTQLRKKRHTDYVLVRNTVNLEAVKSEKKA